MTAVLRAALLAALSATSIPAVAAGQDTSPASLLRRIEILERANADLERRVRELEAIIQSEPSQGRPIPASNKWKDLANWRQLRQGMKPDQVRALLGEPESVDGGDFTFWRWPGAFVIFYEGKLHQWSEPR
jgi:hypothetical protein